MHVVVLGQQNEHQKLIKEFEKGAQQNLSFQNGLFITITEPKDDHDALKKGFAKMQMDNERAGGWTIFESELITVDHIEFTSILYEYKNKKYIAVHQLLDDGNYFFRIYNPDNYIKK